MVWLNHAESQQKRLWQQKRLYKLVHFFVGEILYVGSLVNEEKAKAIGKWVATYMYDVTVKVTTFIVASAYSHSIFCYGATMRVVITYLLSCCYRLLVSRFYSIRSLLQAQLAMLLSHIVLLLPFLLSIKAPQGFYASPAARLRYIQSSCRAYRIPSALFKQQQQERIIVNGNPCYIPCL